MTDQTRSELESELTEMTRWSGEAPQLWRRALERTKGESRPSLRLQDWLGRAVATTRPWRGVAAMLLIALAVGIFALAGSGSRARRADFAIDSLSRSDAERFKSPADRAPSSAMAPALASTPEGRWRFDKSPSLDIGRGMEGAGTMEGFYAGQVGGTVSGVDMSAGQEPAQRQVVRKASVELRTADVRAAFVKAQMLVSEAGAEYIETSAISGEGEQMQADLTLRVSAARISEVLNALRDVGTVISQQLSGEDVTAQAVDLEARLNNERRIEQELLQLLEARQDAELKDVLELRNHIGSVREQIERLQAQQNHLSRLVSLATVLVIIRHEGKPPEKPKDEGLGAYFGRVMKAAWENGVTGLADSIAWIAATLLGGLIWWIISAAALWMAWRKFAALRAKPIPMRQHGCWAIGKERAGSPRSPTPELRPHD